MIDNNLMYDNYISIDDAAAYLGIKSVTLRNWIKKKPDIPAHRVGKLWKFKRSELDEWIALSLIHISQCPPRSVQSQTAADC